MDTILKGQKLNDEVNAIKRHLQALSNQQLKLKNDHTSALAQRPRRVNIPQVSFRCLIHQPRFVVPRLPVAYSAVPEPFSRSDLMITVQDQSMKRQHLKVVDRSSLNFRSSSSLRTHLSPHPSCDSRFLWLNLQNLILIPVLTVLHLVRVG